MSPGATRCLLADDHPALVAAVSAWLAEAGFEPVGPVPDALRAVDAAAKHAPELALVDYRMPGLPGAELVRRLKEVAPRTRVVVYTAEADEQLVRDALSAGADAIVLKEAPLADLVRALEAVLDGRPYLDPGVTVSRDADEARPRLTPREFDVLRLLAEGHGHDEIARRLGIGSETVRTHSRKAADRLGAKTRTQAVASAIRLGLI